MAKWNTVAAELAADTNRDLQSRSLPTVSGGRFKAVVEDDSVVLVIEDDLGLREWNDRVVLEKRDLADAQRAWDESSDNYWILIDDEIDLFLEEVLMG